MEPKFCIALDVGGTSINSAIVSSDGFILDESHIEIVIDSKGTAENIIQTFLSSIKPLLKFAQNKQFSIEGIGIGMPGPFDYENGICQMKGVDKYEAIYGVNLKEILRKELNFEQNIPIHFENDGWTFARGEAWQGAGKGFNRIIGLTLGTGLGSGFYVNDEMVDSGPGVPPIGWFGGLSYKDGIIDDYISKRAIISMYLNQNNKIKNKIDVKEIANRAKNGEDFAISVFNKIGFLMGSLLVPVLQEFKPECLIIGGKISRSFDLFSHSFIENLSDIDFLKKISRAQNIQLSGILGAGKLLFKRLSS
jgi:glucokinase